MDGSWRHPDPDSPDSYRGGRGRPNQGGKDGSWRHEPRQWRHADPDSPDSYRGDGAGPEKIGAGRTKAVEKKLMKQPALEAVGI